MPRIAVHSGTQSLIGPEKSPGTQRSAVSLRLDKQNAENALAIGDGEVPEVKGAKLTHQARRVCFESQKQAGIMLDIS